MARPRRAASALEAPAGLRPSLGWAEGAGFTVAAVLGAGVLVLPAVTATLAGPAAILAWMLMAVAAAPMALTLGALAVRLPDAGGIAAYAREAFGPRVGRVVGLLYLGTVPVGAPAAAPRPASGAPRWFAMVPRAVTARSTRPRRWSGTACCRVGERAGFGRPTHSPKAKRIATSGAAPKGCASWRRWPRRRPASGTPGRARSRLPSRGAGFGLSVAGLAWREWGGYRGRRGGERCGGVRGWRASYRSIWVRYAGADTAASASRPSTSGP